MATFPTLNPSSRVFSPGVYPHSPFTALSGTQVRVRNSNVMLSSQLRLSFVAITESEMLSIVAHYQTQRGSFQSFPLPSVIWNGATAADYQLTGYGWIYREPPVVTDYPCGYHDVELLLETVPPEGTALLGLDQVIRTAITGSAFAFNGAQLNVSVLFDPGVTGPAGLAETVTWSIAAGSASAAVAASGLNLVVAVAIEKGPDSSGLNALITASLSGGVAGVTNGLAQTVTTSITGSVLAQDASFSSVSLLLHMDGSNNSTTFTDKSNAARTVTAYGNAKISTTQSKIGGASAYFDGTGDYLSVPYSTAFDLGTGDFTIETWFYIAGNSALNNDGVRAAALMSCYPSGNPANGYILLLDGSSTTTGTKLYFFNVVSSVFYSIEYASTISQQTWHHVAVVRNGTTTSIYLNGTSVASGTLGNQNVNAGSNNLSVGRLGFTGYVDEFNGYIDELRITKGVARYTAAFTPSTTAFPDW